MMLNMLGAVVVSAVFVYTIGRVLLEEYKTPFYAGAIIGMFFQGALMVIAAIHGA